MKLSIASGCRSHWSSSCICDLSLISYALHDVSQLRINVEPVPLIVRLLLYPLNLCVLVLLDFLCDLLEWEWWKLFNSNDCNFIAVFFSASIVNIIVNLACTEDYLLYLLWGNNVLILILIDLLEAGCLTEFFNIWVGSSILQKLLGSGNNERLSERSAHLSSKQMEIVSSSWSINNLHVNSLIS